MDPLCTICVHSRQHKPITVKSTSSGHYQSWRYPTKSPHPEERLLTALMPQCRRHRPGRERLGPGPQEHTHLRVDVV